MTAGAFGHCRNRFFQMRLAVPGTKERRYLLARLVHRGPDDVRGALVGQLDDVLGKIRFDPLDPSLRECVGELRHGYGRIVNVASVAGKEGNPNASAYSASKAGVIGFTKSLGKELAGSGIIANALTPATFESPILAQLPQSQVDYMRSKIPMGRLGEVEESAAMVCFMASEECSFTTAATFDTSAGRTTF